MNEHSKPASGWPHPESPFHSGEQALQARMGWREDMEPRGRQAIRAFMPQQHRDFYAELPFLIVGACDAGGQPWASLLSGAPGFVSAPNERTLHIAALPPPGDPLHGCLAPGAPLAVLGIAPAARRRNRANGRIEALTADGFTLAVEQSFGNCPKYIHPRQPLPAPGTATRSQRWPQLEAAEQALIAAADTFFIASARLDAEAGHAAGCDVSHKAGAPGFVRIDDAHTLTIPDYSGNRYFNTLGNLSHDPRAGLLFIDFSGGDLLYLAGRARIVWPEEAAEEVASFAGAERLLRLDIEQVLRIEGGLPWRWQKLGV